MRKFHNFIFVVAIFTTAIPVFAQRDAISKSEYDAALAKSLEASSLRDRLVLTEETFYSGTQVTGKRQIESHFVGNDAKRIDVKTEFNGIKESKDAIRIGDQYFCREGNKEWKQASKDCSKDVAMTIPDGDYDHFVEPDPNDGTRKIYTRRASFADEGSEERKAVRLSSIEIKFITDWTGAIVEYVETRRGGVEPNTWSSSQVTRYEYEPKYRKITVPTKGQ
ncbi:MAG TPA: hypothetical protein PKD26_05395 [Pyrinomonadaceae bacterium]|nr:hypothetical protein [Pyrinomonadaceae bacterium]